MGALLEAPLCTEHPRGPVPVRGWSLHLGGTSGAAGDGSDLTVFDLLKDIRSAPKAGFSIVSFLFSRAFNPKGTGTHSGDAGVEEPSRAPSHSQLDVV